MGIIEDKYYDNLYYIFNNIDSVSFDITKNIVFYIPIFYKE